MSGNKEEEAHPSCVLKQYSGGGRRCVLWGLAVQHEGEILDFIDPSEARFSLQVKVDMEKIMEKLGGVLKKKPKQIGRHSAPVLVSV